MWPFEESHDSDARQTALTFTLGAAGGLAVGLLLARRRRAAGTRYAGELASRYDGETRYTASGISDAVADPQLTGLEDAVLDAFLGHEVLSERAIDVGAISHGVIELSGTVQTEAETELAVRVASAVYGVETVVNRLEVEAEAEHLDETRRRLADGDPALADRRWEGRRVGMGRPRQGLQTEPDRPDDSQHRVERAIAEADRDQWLEEDLGAKGRPPAAARPADGVSGQDPDFDRGELDNQEPRGQHAAETHDEQPQELRGSSRVGEDIKPGTEAGLQDADVPLERGSDVQRPEGR